jgi:hypothetical protein
MRQNALPMSCIIKPRKTRDTTIFFGCVVQIAIGLLIPSDGLALFIGVAAGVAIYHTYAHLLLKRFARDTGWFRALQKEYQDVWYNR